MAPSIAFVTGGNTGIGYEIVKALLQSPKSYHIFLGTRSLEKGETASEKLRKECPDTKNTFEVIQIDVSSDESIEKAFEKVQTSHGRVDALINNAGASYDNSSEMTLRERLMKAYDVNVVGTHVITTIFVPLLLKSSDPRILFLMGLSDVVGPMAQFYPPVPAGWPKADLFDPAGYVYSKAALNVMMRDWNRKLAGDGVKTWAVSPGFLVTDLGGARERAVQYGAGHASEGGTIIRRVVEGEFDEHVGKMVDKNGLVQV